MKTATHLPVVTRALPARLGFTISLLLLACGASALSAQSKKNCSGTSTGLVPLIDMGTTKHKTYPGGLYPGGNTMPAAHAADGLVAATAIQPLDATGKPSATGKIVLVSIGMSNTTQEFSWFVRISDLDPKRKPAVSVVDCAQGGMDARKVASPTHVFWTNAMSRLSQKGVTAQQVQVAWLKEAVARPTNPFPGHAQELSDLFGKIALNLKAKFPNIRICYLSSRIYAGYTTSALNPEPYAYESAFSVKWLIEKQINGDPSYNHKPSKGTVVSPWLAWGPYLWADGLKPRSDGLTWLCSDFADDGTHPAAGARQKVANFLNQHFTTDPTAKPWYGGTPGGVTLAAVTRYGTACAGSAGTLLLRAFGLPSLGNSKFGLALYQGAPMSLALFYLSPAKANLPVQGCALLVDPNQIFYSLQTQTGATGVAQARFQVPNDPALMGAKAYAQWINQDSKSSNLQLIGGGAATQGAEILVGR